MSPQLIASALIPLLSSAGIVSAIGFTGVAYLALGLGYAATAALAYGASALFANANQPSQSAVPKPQDGKYNLRQNVPFLPFVLGRTKKASDYILFEEKGGTSIDVLVPAAHRINRFVRHYLNDRPVNLNGSGYASDPTDSEAFAGSAVRILTRTGLNAETAYSQIVSLIPSAWTNDHRGDGLASVAMFCKTVKQEDFQKRYPNGAPQHSSEIEGAFLFDPRNPAHDPDDRDTWSWSDNLALERLWHVTHPVGGKLTLDDMYLPDWIAAANVCDETVTNRQGGTERRYHGGFWFRADTDPVAVGRIMDEAAEMVIYERGDGLIGVHAGKFVEPTIRLDETNIISLTLDTNRRRNSNVLAVRGRYTDPTNGYNTVDAAIYGNPYSSQESDERTKTVDNQAVQSHHHCARLQKIKRIRANAPRVTVVAQYDAAEDVPEERFIRVRYPRRGLVEANVELIGRPKISLRNLTVEFEAIVVPANLYAFNAATEEGEPNGPIVEIGRDPVPPVAGFDVLVQQETVAGGATAAFALASWNAQSEAFTVEVEWQPTAGGAIQTGTATGGETEFKSPYLPDGVQYRFRARNWSADTPSAWTAYQIRTMTADAVAPGVATFNGPVDVSVAGEATIGFTAPNSGNYAATRIYVSTTNDFGTAALATTEYGAPNASDSSTITLTAGTYYAWLVAANASGVTAAPVATGSFTVI